MPDRPRTTQLAGPPRPRRPSSSGPDQLMIVRDVLRAALVRGRYESAPLPSEAELQRMFGASRATVRKALDLLRAEGLIHRLRGTGTLVGIEKISQLDDGFHGLGGPGSSIVHIVAERRVMAAPELIAPLIDVAPGAPILYLRRKTITGAGLTVSMFSSYLTLPLAEPLLERSADLSGEYYSTVEALLGRRIQEHNVILETQRADDVTAAEMQVQVGSPMFRYERVLWLDHNEPLEFGVGFQRGDWVRLERARTRD